MENGPVEIVDFPMQNGGSVHCYVLPARSPAASEPLEEEHSGDMKGEICCWKMSSESTGHSTSCISYYVHIYIYDPCICIHIYIINITVINKH